MFSLVWQRIQRKKCSPTPPKKKEQSLYNMLFLIVMVELKTSSLCLSSCCLLLNVQLRRTIPLHTRTTPNSPQISTVESLSIVEYLGRSVFLLKGGGEESNHLLVKHVCNMLLGKLTSPWCKVTSSLPSSKSYKPLHDSSSFVSIDPRKNSILSHIVWLVWVVP